MPRPTTLCPASGARRRTSLRAPAALAAMPCHPSLRGRNSVRRRTRNAAGVTRPRRRAAAPCSSASCGRGRRKSGLRQGTGRTATGGGTGRKIADAPCHRMAPACVSPHPPGGKRRHPSGDGSEKCAPTAAGTPPGAGCKGKPTGYGSQKVFHSGKPSVGKAFSDF